MTFKKEDLWNWGCMMMVYLALSAFCAARSLVFPLFCPFLQPRFHRLGKLLFTRVGVKTLNLSLLGERRADDFKNGSLVFLLDQPSSLMSHEYLM